jgi:hypothetical protein
MAALNERAADAGMTRSELIRQFIQKGLGRMR